MYVYTMMMAEITFNHIQKCLYPGLNMHVLYGCTNRALKMVALHYPTLQEYETTEDKKYVLCGHVSHIFYYVMHCKTLRNIIHFIHTNNCIIKVKKVNSPYSLFSLGMFTYTSERQDIIQIALKRLPGGGERRKISFVRFSPPFFLNFGHPSYD
jgi:hypothetical protein